MLVTSMDAGKAAAKYEKRKNAVEAVMRGEPVSVVARVNAVPQRTIFGWLARYRAGGWHALEEGRRSGRPRKVAARYSLLIVLFRRAQPYSATRSLFKVESGINGILPAGGGPLPFIPFLA